MDLVTHLLPHPLFYQKAFPRIRLFPKNFDNFSFLCRIPLKNLYRFLFSVHL